MHVAQKLALILLAAAAPVATAAPVAACYQVPVGTALRPYASFKVEHAYVTKAVSGAVTTITIGYDLPKDIAGEANPFITLTGTLPLGDGEFFQVREEASDTTGQCVATQVALTCMLHYAGLVFNPDTTADYLKTHYPNDPVLAKRLDVMRAFSGDGVGILTADL